LILPVAERIAMADWLIPVDKPGNVSSTKGSGTECPAL
jgi:hypothetical protein